MTSARLRRRRRRLLVRLLLPLLVVAVGATAYWVISARTVVPGLSARVYPIHFVDDIARVAARYDVDPYLVAAVARTESNFSPGAVSHAGAVGMMQLMPDTAQWITRLKTWKGSKAPVLTDPADSLELGACYLAYLLNRFSGDEVAALASYNAGQGAVDGWLRTGGGTGGLRAEDIPFDETRDFVKRVIHYRDLYTRIHPEVFGVGTRPA